MPDETFLLQLAGILFLGTALAALAPFVLSLSGRASARLSVISSGLLVGAALFVVIPEGIDAVYRAKHAHQGWGTPRTWVGVALLAGFVFMFLIDSIHSHEKPEPAAVPASIPSPYLRPLSSSHSPSRPAVKHRASLLSRGASGFEECDPLLSAPRHSPTRPRMHSPTSSVYGRSERGGYDSCQPAEGTHDLTDDELESGRLILLPDEADMQPPAVASSKMSIVIGLVAHSIADGLALGASTLASSAADGNSPGASGSSSREPLSLIVFLAILLHKFPTAFALSSLLVRSTSRQFAALSLLAFCAASPLAAIVGFNLLASLGATEGGDGHHLGSTEWWTGVGLVFSGGTFLFVATAVMKDGADQEKGDGWRLGEKAKVALSLAGMLIPAILAESVQLIKHR